MLLLYNYKEIYVIKIYIPKKYVERKKERKKTSPLVWLKENEFFVTEKYCNVKIIIVDMEKKEVINS